MALFAPDYIFERVEAITPAFLAAHGIKALVLDVDNTLTAHGSQALSPAVQAWLTTMRKAGIDVREDFVAVFQPHAVHRGRQHFEHLAVDRNQIAFLRHIEPTAPFPNQ